MQNWSQEVGGRESSPKYVVYSLFRYAMEPSDLQADRVCQHFWKARTCWRSHSNVAWTFVWILLQQWYQLTIPVAFRYMCIVCPSSLSLSIFDPRRYLSSRPKSHSLMNGRKIALKSTPMTVKQRLFNLIVIELYRISHERVRITVLDLKNPPAQSSSSSLLLNYSRRVGE